MKDYAGFWKTLPVKHNPLYMYTITIKERDSYAINKKH